MPQKRGFTLVEVMIVVAIIGIMAALAVPEFTGVLRRTRAKSQLANVEKHLRGARNMARSTLCAQQFTVDSAAQTLTFGPVATSGDCATLLSYVRGLDADLVDVALPTVAGATTNPIIFDAKGGTPYSQDAVVVVDVKVDLVADASIHVWPLVGTVVAQ